MMRDITVGFIGFGNMAQALADGLLQKEVLSGERMYACARDPEKLARNTRARGIHACANAEELAKKADVIIIAVKPYTVPEILPQMKHLLAEKIVISVAVGLLFDYYEKLLAPGTRHLSTLPNIPISAGEGILICEERNSLTAADREIVESLFGKIALLEWVDASQMAIAGTISGCGPAFASIFIEALGDAAVLHGLPRTLAYNLAEQMTAGTGKFLLQNEMHPGILKDAVCSPGGTTIAGVAALERKGFRSAVIDAIDAIQKR